MGTRRREEPVQLELPPPGASFVSLTRGRVAIIDAEDAAAVAEHSWYLDVSPTRVTPYAATTMVVAGRKRTVKLHQFLWVRWGRPWCPKIDHADQDGLNNRRQNLRPANCSQNNINVRSRRDNTSGYKGVSWDRRKNRWRAQISVHRKRYSIGYYQLPEDAARAYDVAARQNFGVFAPTNFPTEASA